jgi:hypothetical protein
LLCIAVAAMASSCKKALVAANIDPETLYSVDPGNQFQTASNALFNSYEFYADYYRDINPWMQYTVGSAGNSASFNVPSAFNTRYSNFYNGVGNALADIPQLIAKMTPAEQAARVYENDIATIYMAFYAFYVSDINGSIPYTQAFEARYGGTLTPVYDTQENLFDTLDVQIKAAVTSLETTQSVTQVLYGSEYDGFFGSASNEVLEWIKAGNALRLKIATRLMTQEPSVLQTIAAEVLADPNQMSSVADSWMMSQGIEWISGTADNSNPANFLATEPLVNFMQSTGDPRLTMFYRPVTGTTSTYIGSPTSPDSCLTSANQALYTADAFSPIQHKLFAPGYIEPEDGGVATNGTSFIPLITYAEYCFIRADLGARGITTDAPATWYNSGVTASIQFYDQRCTAALIGIYTPVTQAQITSYLAAPGIAYNSTIGIQQIDCQAYLDFFRQPSEAWAWWKRTGYPNTTSVVPWSNLTSSSLVLTLPRRASFTAQLTSAPNYTNTMAAYTAMEAQPGFGTLSDDQGRIWWDQ